MGKRDLERDLDSVLGDILGMIPQNEAKLIAKLESIKSGIWYTAPEAMAVEWRRVADVLIDHIGEPQPGWQKEVAMCFRGDR